MFARKHYHSALLVGDKDDGDASVLVVGGLGGTGKEAGRGGGKNSPQCTRADHDAPACRLNPPRVNADASTSTSKVFYPALATIGMIKDGFT